MLRTRIARPIRLAAVIALVVAFVPGVAAGAQPKRATAGPPQDYRKIAGLSRAKYFDWIKQSYMLPMSDGVEVYVEVTRPKANGRFPVIAEISPYHGTIYERNGVRMLPEEGGLTEYFVPRGYAVLMMDVRGTGRSQGCLDHMGPEDQSDARDVVEWAAARNWSNGRVAAIGHSYPGGTSVMTLAQRPKGLATVVVSAGLGSMYEHQFQAGVPFNAQFLGPNEAYYELSIDRHLPPVQPGYGDNFGNDMQYFGCGATKLALVSGDAQLSGEYAGWHAERDFRRGAASARVPVFAIHGVMDEAARVGSLDWFLRRNGRLRLQDKRVVDKLWLGPWDHGIGCCPNRRGYHWTLALHAWFDRHLQRKNVDTGPPVEVFLGDGTEAEAATGVRSEIFTARRFPGTPRTLNLYPDRRGVVRLSKDKVAGAFSFTGDPFGQFAPRNTGAVEFRTAPFRRSVLFAGVPKLDLVASVTMPRVYLIATLYDEDRDGEWRRMTQFAINPELRNGIATTTPVVPGEKYHMRPPGFPMAHHLKPGHRLLLRVTTSDPDKLAFFSVDPQITVFTGPGDTALHLPVVDRPVLYPDRLSLAPPKT